MPVPPRGQFGPAVIGQEAFDAEAEYLTEHKDVFGPAVIGDHPPTAPAGGPRDPGDEQQPSPADTYMMSVTKLRKILEANPLEVDAFVRAELARPEGVRITALKAMLEAEGERPGPDGSAAPRGEVVSMIEGAINELQSADD